MSLKVASSILKSTVKYIMKNDMYNELLLFSDFQAEAAREHALPLIHAIYKLFHF